MAELRDDDRGVSAVVGKTLAIGLALLYIAGMTTVLFGGVVPDYREQTGAELGDRVLATAAGNVEETVPAVDGSVDTRREVTLPETIERRSYTLTVTNHTLTLEHPQEEIGGETRLALPDHVTVENGTYHSHGTLVIRVTGPPGDWRLSLEENK